MRRLCVMTVLLVAMTGVSCSSPQDEQMDPVGGVAGQGGAGGSTFTPGAPPPGGGTAAPAPTGGSSGTTGAPGGTTGGVNPSTGAGTGGDGGNVATCPDCAIPPECQGISFDGIKYSPGGAALPNKCEPFHPTTNNPYAVRCIDAYPDFETGFPGDEYCILPPPPELGMQVGLHPQGDVDTYWEQIWAGDYSGYQNPPAESVVEAGGEITQNYRGHATNTEEKNYYRTYFRMRTGSHHNIITMHPGGMPDEWIQGIGDALPGLFDSSSGAVQGVLGGQQRPDDSTPVSFEKPPEDEGLYLVFPAAPSIIFNMHHFNTTDGPILREGWSNIWWEEDARVRASWYMGLAPEQLLTLSVSPNRVVDFHYAWNVSAELRLLRVFGHRHFWTPNFSTWIERATGETELIYQSYDWADMPTYRYDSVAQNPPLAPEMKNDGAVTGIVNLHPGDQLHFNCHVEFTDEHAAGDPKAPMPSELGNLRFANQAYTGEMCIQFGNVTGGSLGLPGSSTTPVPDFAKAVR
jgi:hypothetical protein